jgi:hypothetical protein
MRSLPPHQPVERFVRLLLVHRPEPEHLGERTGPFAARLPAALGQNPLEPEPAQGVKRRCHMAVRQRSSVKAP